MEISRQAAPICYVERHDEPLAAIFSSKGAVTGLSRGSRFPWIKLKRGDRPGSLTQAGRILAGGRSGPTEMREATPAAWLSEPDVELFEQTSVSASGRATTLLWTKLPDAGDDEEDEVHRPLSAPRFPR
ncbi:hypothetical protein P2H44_24445 [Albimonas sp. CAU 1670]|uniref:hypothetical protein n=1 Tax=Albimonas sp. CAU 1670 TaxID=3032599 RepID=UPI0023DC0ECF|nr:hypothetical protein [Albimonas sp. CAU 1670]MDF2235718.1 hypothetical protein [Albimonas sp. CAU 1670]